MVIVGVKIKLDPATIADLQSPLCKAWQASCNATREDEHPVRIVMLFRSVRLEHKIAGHTWDPLDRTHNLFCYSRRGILSLQRDRVQHFVHLSHPYLANPKIISLVASIGGIFIAYVSKYAYITSNVFATPILLSSALHTFPDHLQQKPLLWI